MPLFQYEAMNTAGQKIRSEIDAASSEQALAQIRERGHFPTKVKAARLKKPATTTPRRRIAISLGRVSTRVLTDFTQQLSILQDAGLPIVRSLKILWQQERAGVFKNTLAAVATSVEDGTTLSEAMARHPRAFDRLYVNMVHAGESGGVLDVILQRLSEFMEKAQRLKRRILGALIYPAVVITFSFAIVMGIMIFVVPRFQAIFDGFREKLPALTLMLLGTANFIAYRKGWLVILAVPALAWAAYAALGRTNGGRRAKDMVLLRLPVIGRIARKTAIARFSRTLGTLLAAGVPILDALTIARDTVGNSVFEHALRHVHDAIREGEGFAGPLRRLHVCDPIVTNMIDVGEETGELDKMLLKIADTYDDQVDVLVGSLVSLLEPVMVITLGGIVGTIVVALFLPLTHMIDMANNAAN